MAILNVRIDVPDNLIDSFNSGKIILKGLAKETGSNKVVKHLDLVGDAAKNKNIGKGLLIGIGVAAVATVSAIVIKKIVANKREKDLKKKAALVDTEVIDVDNAMQIIADNYNNTLIDYISGVKTGTLSLNDIKKLIEYFDFILEHKKKGDITIDISQNDLETLKNIIMKFTEKLASINNYEIDNNVLKLSGGKLEEIKEYLYIQREIFEG